MESDEDILSKLKFLTHVQKNQKIDTINCQLYSNNSFTAIYRTVRRDDARSKALSFVNHVLNRSFDILKKHLQENKSSSSVQISAIINDLGRLKISLENLKFTYQEDIYFQCRLETTSQSISARLTELQHLHPNIQFIVSPSKDSDSLP